MQKKMDIHLQSRQDICKADRREAKREEQGEPDFSHLAFYSFRTRTQKDP